MTLVVQLDPTTCRDSNGVVIMLNMAKPKLGVSAMEVMTAPEAARYIGVHERTLAAMRARGDGPVFTRKYLSGRGVRYSRSDLDAWINAREAAA
ncbi:helix-turn-helix transcriptional regulator [Novosphingobium subterraneum]|uniref:Helix-turn-helix domain protein n=1 Tax=Novosphingobium subterraneum TaxID=48936 RepID=A0A0B8ZYM9_9SPHN|nr:helix-turn-helix domain-containing protein [Novosphingobium subterraneum]KHS43401.1 Helix-turn-helix domain protein [Novosphingobium subterraneum]